jgi:hypothetical protein
MKEEQAKTKRCGGPNGCGTLVNPIHDGKLPQVMLLQLALEVNSPRWCIGSECMMWSADQNVEQKKASCDSSNEPKTSRPDGDDWHVINTTKHTNKPNEIGWRRFVDTDSGDCGLKQEIRYE